MMHSDCSGLFAELKRRQANACYLPMHTRRNRSTTNAVCKWEHVEMKATIRNFLAA
jgi:hypothetical protein